MLTNDDGINAPGMKLLLDALGGEHELTVYAPDRERSASGQRLTIDAPIRIETLKWDGISAYKIYAAPADCVKIAIQRGETPDLVVSGVNRGANLGTDTFYSGTLGAAREGMFTGYPALALSLGSFIKDGNGIADEDYVKHVIRRAVAFTIANPPPPRSLLNMNIPNVSRDKISGYALCPLSFHYYDERVKEYTDPGGRTWAFYDFQGRTGVEAGTDVDLFYKHYVTLTPMSWDTTHHTYMAGSLKACFDAYDFGGGD